MPSEWWTNTGTPTTLAALVLDQDMSCICPICPNFGPRGPIAFHKGQLHVLMSRSSLSHEHITSISTADSTTELVSNLLLCQEEYNHINIFTQPLLWKQGIKETRVTSWRTPISLTHSTRPSLA